MFVKKEDWNSLIRRVEVLEERHKEHENFAKYVKFIENFPDRVSYGLETVRDINAYRSAFNRYDFPSWGYPGYSEPICWAGHITYARKGETEVVTKTVVKSSSIAFKITDAKWDIDDRYILVHCRADKSNYVIKWDTCGKSHKMVVNGIEFPIIQQDADGCIIFS
jgi:hypothetical protein